MKQFKTLQEIRDEKVVVRRRVKNDVQRLRNDVVDSFVPSNSIFLNSNNKYMNFIGYAITAYKTASSVRGVYNFFAKLF